MAQRATPSRAGIDEPAMVGAYPASRPVTLAEFVATLYRKMDLNPNLDDRLRPFVGPDEPVAELL